MVFQSEKSKFLIVSIIPRDLDENDAFENIQELIRLTESYGGVVKDIVLQKREIHDKGGYIGRGKIEEIAEIIAEQKIDVVVLNAIVVPGQIYDLTTTFQKANNLIEVWDRVDLILKIFSKRAFTAEAKLQIELAAMRHMGPRIFGMGLDMSRQGGGIGTRGIGETNTERMKRHWRNEIKKTKERLAKVLVVRSQQMINRQEVPLKTVSLVGYTNAGKTSLFNVLTKKNKDSRDELFATLQSYTGKVYLPDNQKEILLSDTIGFIRDLPPELIDAFRSTLMESINADLLLHVIDCADPDMKRKVEVVNQTLTSLGLESKPVLLIYNKIDLLAEGNASKIDLLVDNEFHTKGIALSAEKKIGLSALLTEVGERLY